ncbi:MAG: hypothetical protein BWY92_01755 [Firmicutes bacterium ADurb.BinA052]|nr:MAG: hypothetical protein BWY92_01755 [Firmicutes bacterium ADurb.BinA052]
MYSAAGNLSPPVAPSAAAMSTANAAPAKLSTAPMNMSAHTDWRKTLTAPSVSSDPRLMDTRFAPPTEKTMLMATKAIVSGRTKVTAATPVSPTPLAMNTPSTTR